MRIVVVEDQVLFRDFLIDNLTKGMSHEIVGIAGDGKSALEVVRREKPDLIILDVLIPKLSGILVAKAVREEFPHIRILVLTNQMDAKTLYQIQKLYLAGFVDKNDASKEILAEAIEAIKNKKRYFSESMWKSVTHLKMDPISFQKILTKREQEILSYIGAGLSDDKIGEILGLSTKSIQSHRSNLLRKVGVHSTPELIVFACEMGFWKPQFKKMDLTNTYHNHE